MLISAPARIDLKLNVSIDGTVLETAESVKILGITVDWNLNANEHVPQIRRKAGRQPNVFLKVDGMFW